MGKQLASRLLLAGTIAIVVGVMMFVPPVAQPLAYHAFVDTRPWLSIPNAGNVLSNVPFVAVGLGGLIVFARGHGAIRARMWPLPYAVYLIAIAWVGFGSAWYHWAPDNAALVWDRLPMSVAFMAVFDALIADRLGDQAGKRFLAPLLLVGAGSVFYWAATDDLRPYGLVQFLPMVVALALCALAPARAGLQGATLVAMFALYGLAKLFELGDEAIWRLTGETVSGHTLKHLAAAASAAPVVLLLQRRATSS